MKPQSISYRQIILMALTFTPIDLQSNGSKRRELNPLFRYLDKPGEFVSDRFGTYGKISSSFKSRRKY